MTPSGERHALHRRAVDRCVRALHRHGLSVERIRHPGGIDLSVGHGLSCAVRAARPRAHRHHITVGGRRYSYTYGLEFWNLHQHGKRTADPDIWLLVGGSTVYVVPAHELAGRLTYSLLVGAAQRKRLARARQYADRWDVIERALLGRMRRAA
jgi:hypothetical protein